jgi:tetratricopeptide (TPR) repeat protein
MPNDIVREILNLIKARWYRPSTLIILVFFAAIVLLSMFSAIKIEEMTLPEVIISIAIIVGLAFLWYTSTRMPKATKGKVGFAVGIVAETQEQRDLIARDFVETLRNLLSRSEFKYHFSFLEIPAHLAQKIESPDDAHKVLNNSRCQFLVYGRARTRRIQGEERHVLDLQGIVSHSPIPQEVQKHFSKEFGELFPNKLVISSENDIFSFEFTAEWVSLVARYIIGIAALVSGDILYSQQLFESLEQEVVKPQTDFPAIIKLRQRVPQRLASVYLTRASIYFQEWRQTKDLRQMADMEVFLNQLRRVAPNEPGGHLLKAIWLFVTERDIRGAKDELERCRIQQDATWQYNYAFLLAYEGNLKKAFKEYKRASQAYTRAPGLLLEVENFICWVLENEPDKIQLHFCLGLLNFFGKDDKARAMQDFEEFLTHTPPDQFVEERRLSGVYIEQIRGQLKAVESGK